MIITTENEVLTEILQTGKTKHRKFRDLPKSVINKFLRVVKMMDAATSLNDIKMFNGLNLELLNGSPKNRRYSIRLDRKYRLIFTCTETDNSIEIEIVTVDLIEISKHYDT